MPTLTRWTTRAALVAAALTVAACKKPPEGGAHLEQVQAAFKKEGWKLDGFQPTDPAKFSAQKCIVGALEGIEAVLCEFGSAEAVQRGRKATEGWVGGAVTGVALDNGRTTLGLADRGRVDTNGKLIHRISKAYREIK